MPFKEASLVVSTKQNLSNLLFLDIYGSPSQLFGLRSHRRNSSKMIINYEVKQCLIFIHLYVNKRYGWNVYQKRDKRLCANFSMLVRPFKQTGGWRGQQVTSQGSLTEREYSVQLTSLSQLFKYSSFFHGNIVYLFYETGYLNEEVNCTEPFPLS
jgi:hypothetical protein